MAARRRFREGVVVSDKMDKTVVVVVERLVRHRRYQKYRRLRTRYKAHDQQNRCRVGDLVRVVESRPLSAGKRWAVQAVLGRTEALSEPRAPEPAEELKAAGVSEEATGQASPEAPEVRRGGEGEGDL